MPLKKGLLPTKLVLALVTDQAWEVSWKNWVKRQVWTGFFFILLVSSNLLGIFDCSYNHQIVFQIPFFVWWFRKLYNIDSNIILIYYLPFSYKAVLWICIKFGFVVSICSNQGRNQWIRTRRFGTKCVWRSNQPDERWMNMWI